MNKIYSTLLVTMLSIYAWAVPATPDPIQLTQQDGSQITVYLHGDESFSYYTLTDGTPLKKDSEGNYRATTMDDITAQRESVEAVKKVRRIAQSMDIQSSYPLTGSPKSLVILVSFTDCEFSVPNARQAYTDLLNEEGYTKNSAIGSACDYFKACSNGVFSPQFDVYGPYMLNNKMSYYGENSGTSNDVRANEMIIEACLKMDADGNDITQYDTDGDGYIDNVFVYYAGHNEAEGAPATTVWPHRSVVTDKSAVVQGKRIYDYACTSEYSGSTGNSMCGIGTFCHEFGHVLGLPDYYDTKDNGHETVGRWDIMCSGSYNGNGKTPPSYTALERFQLGWHTPVQLDSAGVYTLEPLETTNTSYLIAQSKHNMSFSSANPSEYFVLENRQYVGWDSNPSCLPSAGMLVWHIDYSATAWLNNTPNNNTTLRYHMEPSQGKQNYSSMASKYTFPTSSTDHHSPTLHNGTDIEQPVFNIVSEQKNITFIFKSTGNAKIELDKSSVATLETTYDPKRYPSSNFEVIDSIMVSGQELMPGVTIQFTTSNRFQFSFDGENWSESEELDIVQRDSTFTQKLYLRYNPGKLACSATSGNLMVKQIACMTSLELKGICTRPIYIVPPTITEVFQLTPYSVNIAWDPQSDAEYYFITMYHIEDRSSEVMQGFENFDNPVKIKEQGWQCNASVSTTQKSEGVRSIIFANTGEYVQTPSYPQPINKLSFWLNAIAVDNESEIGSFTMTALDDKGKEVKSYNIQVLRTTKQTTKEFDFGAESKVYSLRLDYTSVRGKVAMDAFTMKFEKEVVYDYQGRDYTVEAMNGIKGVDPADYTVAHLNGLMPAHTYFISMQCSEQKGCEENLSDLAEPLKINTLAGEDIDSRRMTVASGAIDSLSYDKHNHVVFIPEVNAGAVLYIYNTSGMLVYSVELQPTVNAIELPTRYFVPGTPYIIKYAESGRLARKQKYAKFIF